MLFEIALWNKSDHLFYLHHGILFVQIFLFTECIRYEKLNYSPTILLYRIPQINCNNLLCIRMLVPGNSVLSGESYFAVKVLSLFILPVRLLLSLCLPEDRRVSKWWIGWPMVYRPVTDWWPRKRLTEKRKS